LDDKGSNWAYLRFLPSGDEVDAIHAAKKRIFIAGPTVAGQETANWRASAEAGVDGILTDFPLELSRILRGQE
jgi:hypothetical protein